MGPLGTRVADSCKPPYGCWELNPGSLENQPVLLTAKPFLQPSLVFSKSHMSFTRYLHLSSAGKMEQLILEGSGKGQTIGIRLEQKNRKDQEGACGELVEAQVGTDWSLMASTASEGTEKLKSRSGKSYYLGPMPSFAGLEESVISRFER